MGLKKSEPKTLARALSKAIFGVDCKLKIINYLDEDVHFEIFISSHSINSDGQIAHVCLEVDSLPSLLEKCDHLGIDVSLIPKGDRTLTFIRDFDGNLFEIK